MTVRVPRYGFGRELVRYEQSQNVGITSTVEAINIAPMRELIPQIGPIRRTDGITGAGAMTNANDAIYVPFVINADYWDVNAFYWTHGTTGNNSCVAIYSEAGVRLIS